jgi:competence protein ComGC
MSKMRRAFSICILFVAIMLMFSVPSFSEETGTVKIAGFDSDKLVEGIPEGWELEKNSGTVDLSFTKEECGYALRLKSDKESSYGIKKKIKLNLEECPYLNWTWKADKLPKGADVRKQSTDDQAIQIYVIFREVGWPAKFNTPVIGYIWDTDCPKGTEVTSPQLLADKVRYIVLRNKNDELGRWFEEKRNIKEDYKKLFPDIDGGKLRNTEGVAFYINSQHTKSEAESCIYNVYFSGD